VSVLALELFQQALAEGRPTPDAVIDLTSVSAQVAAARARLPHAPGERLPRPKASQLPWPTAVYEYLVDEAPEPRCRHVLASQARLGDGSYVITMAVVDIVVAGDEVRVANYGGCNVHLEPDGAPSRLERIAEPGDESVVAVGDGELMEMLFPALMANHLLNTGVVSEDALEVITAPGWWAAAWGEPMRA